MFDRDAFVAAKEKEAAEKQQTKTNYAPAGECAQESAGRRLGGEFGDDLRKKLYARRELLQHELREVDFALSLINGDPEVGKVLEVISVANKSERRCRPSAALVSERPEIGETTSTASTRYGGV